MPSPQQLATWLKEHLGPFPYGDHISLTKEETDAIWLKLGTDLHEFINEEGGAEHVTYIDFIGGGTDGYRGACETCGWRGPTHEASPDGKALASRDHIAHNDGSATVQDDG